MTDHELNVKAAELLGRTWKGAILHMHPECVYYAVEAEDEDGEVESIDWCFSPATSIEDAMGLLDTLAGGDPKLGLTYVLSNCAVEVYGNDGNVHEVVSPDPATRPRRITEAFIAAMEASG